MQAFCTLQSACSMGRLSRMFPGSVAGPLVDKNDKSGIKKRISPERSLNVLAGPV